MEKKLKTRGIGLKELRGCDVCGGSLAPFFKVVTMEFALFNRRNLQGVLGTTMILGGPENPGALAIAAAMAPGADEIVTVSEEADTTIELFICQKCEMGKICLAEVAQKRHDAIEKRENDASQRNPVDTSVG